MTHAEIVAATREFVQQNFLYTHPDVELEPDAPLLGSGIVDSLGVMELVAFVQETLDVAVEDDDLTEENLGTLDSIARWVLAKRARATQDLHAA